MANDSNIEYILEEMKQSENRWLSLFTATWTFASELEKVLSTTDEWDNLRKFPLPASKDGFYESTPKNIHDIATNRDYEISVIQLLPLFSLFEEILKEAFKHLYKEHSEEDLRKLTHQDNMLKFLKGENPYKKVTERLILREEEPSFILARHTRNNFLHNKSNVNEAWLSWFHQQGEDFKPKKEQKPEIGKRMPIGVIEVQDWTALIIKISERIEAFIYRS